MTTKIPKGYRQILPGLCVKQYPLITKELEKAFEKNPLFSHEGNLMEVEVITAYYTPFYRGRWIIIEGEKMRNGDYLLYGYCHITEWEWGSVYLSELQKLIDNGIYIERDLNCRGKKVKDLLYQTPFLEGNDIYSNLPRCDLLIMTGGNNNDTFKTTTDNSHYIYC